MMEVKKLSLRGLYYSTGKVFAQDRGHRALINGDILSSSKEKRKV